MTGRGCCAQEDERRAEVEAEFRAAESALEPAIKEAKGVRELKQQLWTARQKLEILDVLMTAEHNAVADYVPEDEAERALAVAHGTSNGRPVSWHPFVNPRGLGPSDELDEEGRFAAAAAAAELVLRNERWATDLHLKGTVEASRWYKEAKVTAERCKGAVALVSKLVAAVSVPDGIEDAVEDVLRLSVLVLGDAGAGRGARDIVLPIRATVEMLVVKLVEKNWPMLSPDVCMALQLVYNGRSLPRADALVEHEIVSGDQLHLLLPSGATLPPDNETNQFYQPKSSTGFVDGTADGLSKSIASLKARLSSISFVMAESQWAVTRAVLLDREICWIDGARERLTSLRQLVEDSGAGVPRTKLLQDEADKLEAMANRKKKRGDPYDDDWSWAPGGVKEAASRAQLARLKREQAALAEESERTKPASLSKTGVGVEDWRFTQVCFPAAGTLH